SLLVRVSFFFSHRLIYLSSHYVFFLMIPRPPRFTLFPYTTLFRSGCFTSGSRALYVDTNGDVLACPFCHISSGNAMRDNLQEVVDRKSTRLNSSHVEISYAVFCLKKKKNINQAVYAHHGLSR